MFISLRSLERDARTSLPDRRIPLKITIQQAELNKALQVVSNVVPSKSPLPSLICVLMETEGNLLTLSATNLDMSVTTTVAGIQVAESGRIAVPAAKFISFIRSLNSGEVTITEKSGKLSVTAGKASFSESSMNADEFPSLPQVAAGQGYELLSKSLVSMIKATAYAVSRDETRPALMGLLWEIKPTSLAMVATDAHRLAKIEQKMDWGVTDITNLIADTQGLLQYVRLAENEEITQLFIGSNQITFKIGPTTLHTRILEGPFPDYTAVIPKGNDLQMTVDRESFMAAVRRVSITADRITSQIRLGMEPGRMELSSTGTDGSRAEDEIPVAYDGGALEIGFNYGYLLDVLKNIGSNEVQLMFKDAQSATLLSPVSDDESSVLCLLMPLRLTSE